MHKVFILSTILITTITFCRSLEEPAAIVNREPPETLAKKNENEIKDMISFLLGKKPEDWPEPLPSFFGLDERNQQIMIIVPYCGSKKCQKSDYMLFLVYRNVNLKKCAALKAQPLINPRNNHFIGCEPTYDKEEPNPEL